MQSSFYQFLTSLKILQKDKKIEAKMTKTMKKINTGTLYNFDKTASEVKNHSKLLKD